MSLIDYQIFEDIFFIGTIKHLHETLGARDRLEHIAAIIYLL